MKIKNIVSIILIPLFVTLIISCQKQKTSSKITIISADTLSTNGSTRATAYMMSNKIITANGKIFMAWLDRVADIQIKEYDIKNDQWSETVLLGQGVDNHSGPAITMDSEGYLYAVFGPHHGPFQFRKSSKPYQIKEWEQIEHFGVTATYPSLICDQNDVLHITYRGGQEPWRLMYQQKPKNGDWTEPRELVHSGVEDGYTQYGNPITFSADGTLHLGFHIYDFHPESGKSVGYLKSKDGGKTWENAQGTIMEMPVNPKSDCFIEQGPELDMRAGSIVTDKANLPWLTVFHNEKNPRSSTIWHFDGQKWQSIELLDFIKEKYPDWGILYSNLTIDQEGMFYMVSVIQKNDATTFWGDKSAEVILITSTDQGKTFEISPISKVDPTNSNWMPSVERPYTSKPIGIPSFLYTHGNRGEGLKDGESTEVIFVRLGK